MSPPRDILFYVQHLLGVGHVFRATRVARALARILAPTGAKVHLVWGGTRMPAMDLAGLDVTFLPPVRSDGEGFSGLSNPDGKPFTEAQMAARRDQLLALFAHVRPAMVITEAFPFGRRQMRFELVPLMRAARAAAWHPVTVASIRDIMQEGRAENRVAESLQYFNAWYDVLLVHGDPALIPIEATLQGAQSLLPRVRYTGLVTPDPLDLGIAPSISAGVVVSAGGGAVGHALTTAAIGANLHCKAFPANWLLIAGPERAQADFEAMQLMAGEGMRVERFVPDLARVLASAKVSVSRAGYNTIGDLLRARCRAVLVPFTGGRESEQLRRAQIFAEAGLALMLRDDELTPRKLGETVDAALALAPMGDLPRMAPLAMDGAENSAKILAGMLKIEHA